MIRGHLYVEAQVNRLIDALVPHPEELADARLGYPQRLDLTISLGLNRRLRPPSRQLATIRNKFAHNPDSRLKESDVQKLYASLNEEDKANVLQSYTLTKPQAPSPPEPGFLELRAKDQFTLIVVALYTILEAAIQRAVH